MIKLQHNPPAPPSSSSRSSMTLFPCPQLSPPRSLYLNYYILLAATPIPSSSTFSPTCYRLNSSSFSPLPILSFLFGRVSPPAATKVTLRSRFRSFTSPAPLKPLSVLSTPTSFQHTINLSHFLSSTFPVRHRHLARLHYHHHHRPQHSPFLYDNPREGPSFGEIFETWMMKVCRKWR